MENKKEKTPIEQLESFTDLSFFDGTVSQGGILLTMKKIILDQNKRIEDLELTIDTIQRQLDSK